MLPGFRFLLAAIVLSTSLLIFGVGAAALLRAAHKEFATAPALRGPAEIVFAEHEEIGPTLAAAQLEPSGPDEAHALQTAADQSATVAAQPEAAQTTAPDQAAEPGEIDAPAEYPVIAATELPPENPVATEIPRQVESATPPAQPSIAVAELTPPDEAPSIRPVADPAPDESTGVAQTAMASLGRPPLPLERPKIIHKPRKKRAGFVTSQKPAQVKPVAAKPRRLARRPPVVRRALQQPASRFANPFGLPFGN